MKYIDIINKFWRSNDYLQLNPTEIALYLYLLNIANNSGWKKVFAVTNRRVMNEINISKSTLQRTRNKLKSDGLIDFSTVNGSSLVRYTLVNLTQVVTQVMTQVVTQDVTQVMTQVVTQQEDKTETKTETISFSFIKDKNLLPIFSSWIEYKKGRNEHYSQQSAEVCFNMLNDWSGGRPEIAQQIINDAIGFNYPRFVRPQKPKPTPGGGAVAKADSLPVSVDEYSDTFN